MSYLRGWNLLPALRSMRSEIWDADLFGKCSCNTVWEAWHCWLNSVLLSNEYMQILQSVPFLTYEQALASAEERAKWLRVHTVPAKDLNLVPQTQDWWPAPTSGSPQQPVTIAPGIHALFWALEDLAIMWTRNMHIHTNTHNF